MINPKLLDLERVEQINSVSSTPIDFTRLFYMLYQEMDQSIRHSDTKAQLVLGVNAVLAASSVSFAPGMAQAFLNANSSWYQRGACLFSLALLVFLLGSIFFALWTVVPHTKKRRLHENLYCFGSIAMMSEEDFTRRFLSLSMDELKATIIAEIHAKAYIVQHKFSSVRLSVNFLFFAVLCWVLARLLLSF